MWLRAVVLKLVSNRRKCVIILLAVLNLYVRIKIHVTTFDTNHSVTESTQAINRCFNPEACDSVVKSSQQSLP